MDPATQPIHTAGLRTSYHSKTADHPIKGFYKKGLGPEFLQSAVSANFSLRTSKAIHTATEAVLGTTAQQQQFEVIASWHTSYQHL